MQEHGSLHLYWGSANLDNLDKGFKCSLWGEGTARNAYKLLLMVSEAGSQIP